MIRTAMRQANGARVHAGLIQTRGGGLASDEVGRLIAEDAKVSEDEACRLAIGQ